MIRFIATSCFLLITCTVSTQTKSIDLSTSQTTLSDLWKFPTVESYEQAREHCLAQVKSNEQQTATTQAYVKCLMSQLGLWSDDTGYNVDRIGKLFAKKGVPVELETLLRFCNESQRQENKDKWAFDAYKCAARGQLAQWIQQYIKQIYSIKQKST